MSRLARQTMGAIVHDKYGSFDVLGVKDIDKPVVKDDEVLVHVPAAGLRVGDCFAVRGAPFVMPGYRAAQTKTRCSGIQTWQGWSRR